MADVSVKGSSGNRQDPEPLIVKGISHGLVSQALPLFCLTFIFFLNFLSRIILAPLMPAVEEDLGLGHGQAGGLFLFISIGYFLTLLGSGIFSSRLMHRGTIILSSITVGIALLFIALTDSLWGIQLGLLFLGMAAGLYLPSGISTLTALIDSGQWGKAIAIHEMAPNLSFVAAPLVSEGLLALFMWRGALGVLGCASLLAGIAFARFGRGGAFPGEVPGMRSFRPLFSEPSFWIMMVLFTLGIGGTLGVYTMLPLYLVAEYGMDRNRANTLIALSRIPGPVMAFLAGWATDRVAPERTMGVIFLLTGSATILLGAAPGPWIVGMVFLQPLIAVCFFPPGFAALSSIGPPASRNIAVSLTVPIAFVLGGGAVPMVIGAVGGVGYFSLGFIIVGGVIFSGFILSFFLSSSWQA